MNIDTSRIRQIKDKLLEQKQRLESIDENSGKKSNQTGQAIASMARIEPFLETMFLMMMADGGAEKRECLAIKNAMDLLTNGLLRQADFEMMLERFTARLTTIDPHSRLQIIGNHMSADKQDREAAFRLAAAVALADDTVATEEMDTLCVIAEWFGISDKRARVLLNER